MRLHRFYISEPVGSEKDMTIDSAELANQVRKVFRLRVGDHVVLFDGSGSDYECEIVKGEGSAKTDKESVSFRVLSAGRSRYVPPRKIYLCAAVVKKDNFEVIVEKATELGVTDIIPVMAERSEKKSLNDARLRKISVEASEQSGRGTVPSIHAICELDVALESMKKMHADLIVFHTEGEKFDASEVAGGDGNGDSKDAPLAIFIGPEGGWSSAELDLFHKQDARVVCLGEQVLRAETAVISALSKVVF